MADSRGTIERVKALLAPIFCSEGMELVDLEFKKGRGRWHLRVFIDREGGVTLDDCANISRQVSAILEVEDFIEQSYVLEVSSPGLDRPLNGEKDYLRFSGKLAKIKTYEPVEGSKIFVGRLRGMEEGSVIIEGKNEGDIVSIPLNNIAKGRLELEF